MDPFVGEIRMVGFNFAPNGWALCNGQTLPISSNQALFALLGTTYGGNGTTNFNLPDLQGRVPLHAGAGAGLPVYVQGEKGGAASIVLSQQQMPSHTHTATFAPSGGGGTPTVNVSISGSTGAGTTATPTGNYLAGVTSNIGGPHSSPLYVPASPTPPGLAPIAGVSATLSGVSGGGGTVTNAMAGSSLPVQIEPPYLAIYFIIALLGVFPSRA
ncbi:MAG TPA: tail fiber protein [Granulicella sp.]|jgi:microcystin-dependent protein|nr:tail fiber protein [Granulicella sp.]